MTRQRRIVNASKLGEHGLRMIGTTDIDGNGTSHEVADVDPIVLFDFATINPITTPTTSAEIRMGADTLAAVKSVSPMMRMSSASMDLDLE